MNIINNKVSIENIQFLDTMENKVMDGNFTKLIYGDDILTINGLYVDFPVKLKSINRNCGVFNFVENKQPLDEIIDLEKKILQYYKDVYLSNGLGNPYKKTIFYAIHRQLLTETLKINSFSMNAYPPHYQLDKPFVLKISGIWENQTSLGLTYKFLQVREKCIYKIL